MHRGYNMNIRYNQKFMFCKDSGIDFCVWFMGFPLYCQTFFGISTLPNVTFGDFHFTTRHFLGFPSLPPTWRKKDTFQRFNRYLSQTFGSGLTKSILYVLYPKHTFWVNIILFYPRIFTIFNIIYTELYFNILNKNWGQVLSTQVSILYVQQ